MRRFPYLPGLTAVLLTAACGGGPPPMPPEAQYGPNPQLPAPHKSLFPTIRVAQAVGWPAGQAPTPAPGYAVRAFARGLTHPRWLYVLPNGDVLVAETNGPGEKASGIRGWFQKRMMKKAGAGVASPERITLLRDADGDGVAETRTVFLDGLRSPFGMALIGPRLYVADTDALLQFTYVTGMTRIETAGRQLTPLPAWPIDHHWTKNVAASPDGSKLYVTVGSNSNVGENGMEAEENRAAILVVDPASGASRVYASGLRNPIGLDWQPQTGRLWTVVNERDEIGDDLVPDYLTEVREDGFYGWPYSYWGRHVDDRVKPQRPDLVARAVVPDYALGSHTAAMGLAFDRGGVFGPRWAGGAFVGQHGSWNRSQPVGYRVIFVPFRDGRPAGPHELVLGGFLDRNGQARGRPVGVAMDRSGALLVADDVGDAVWRVTPAAAGAAPPR
jgi:glucose/arabinose dehydrogenase